MDAQDIFDKYVESFGYAPKNPNHLIAFAKINHQFKITWSQAKKLIAAAAGKNISTKASNFPTIIIRKKAKQNDAKKEYSEQTVQTQKNKDNDEKKEEKLSKINQFDPMICRVTFLCSSEQAKKEIYAALRTFVNLQLKVPHPQTIMYHFTSPNNDLELEFTELYLNQSIYFEHGKHPSFGKAFMNGFKDQNRKARCFITISDGSELSDLIKKINASFESTFPVLDAGYLMLKDKNECFAALDEANETKLMIRCHITAQNNNSKSIQLIVDKIQKIASLYAKQSLAIMFALFRMQQKVYPDRFELLCVWPNSVRCLVFLKVQNVKEIVSELEIKQMTLQIYGEHVEAQVFDWIKTVFGSCAIVQKNQTDIGYILHPNANSKFLNR